eukprot:908761-Amphidinium_carterae.1
MEHEMYMLGLLSMVAKRVLAVYGGFRFEKALHHFEQVLLGCHMYRRLACAHFIALVRHSKAQEHPR